MRYLLARRIRRYHTEVRRLPHRVKEQGHTAAAIGAFAKGMIDLARRDDGVGVGGAHPVDGGADVMVRDGLTVADEHGAPIMSKSGLP